MQGVIGSSQRLAQICMVLALVAHAGAARAGMTATASSEENNVDLAAARAVDGDMGTRWASKFEDNQWLEIDLGEPRAFAGLTIYWEAAYTKEYNILVSTDRADWKSVYSTTSGPGGTETVRFPEQTARYVKIDCQKRGTEWGNSIFEVKLIGASSASSGPQVVDDFESIDGWGEIKSEGVVCQLSPEPGAQGSALGMSFEFPAPTGYVGAGKDLPLNLPDDYKITFSIKGAAEENTLEFKLIDAAGNTYWKKFENFSFPQDWKEITIRKKQIVFAWGPSGGGAIQNVKRVEFAVSCGKGGKGHVLIDDLNLTDLSGGRTQYSIAATASSSEKDELDASRAVDGNMGTRWSSLFQDSQWLELDLGGVRDFVGMVIHWEDAYPKVYDVSISNDRTDWTKVYSTVNFDGGAADLYFKKQSARYIKIDAIQRGTSWGNSIWEIELKGPEDEVRMKASSSSQPVENAMDGDRGTAWHSDSAEDQWIAFNLNRDRDIGLFAIYWDDDYAKSYEILFSSDFKTWNKYYSTQRGNGDRDRMIFKDLEARFVKIHCIQSGAGKGYGIREVEVKGSEYSGDKNSYYEIAAGEAPGHYPKYFSKTQTYWTVVGVSEDKEEALINEEGAFEVGREQFSIEPFLYLNVLSSETLAREGKLITWADVATSQSLEKEYLPIPEVRWDHPDVNLSVKLFAHGPAAASSMYASYRVTNHSTDRKAGKLFLAVRPFQVNPPWQKLNQKGGVAKISKIEYDGDIVRVNDQKKIIPLIRPASFGAARSDAGDVTEWLDRGTVPPDKSAADPEGFASGALEFPFDLAAGESSDVEIVIPFHEIGPGLEPNQEPARAASIFQTRLNETSDWWDQRVSRVEFKVPEKAKKFINTLKSNLAYIFINRDGYRFQPGSRSYLRSWIRDGAMTSSAVLRLGNIKEVKEYLTWYAPNIFPDGRVPCVVDDRGADGTPENDSNGEFIYAFLQYYYFTNDRAFLAEHFPHIQKAADFIVQMRHQRKTDEFKNGPPEKHMLYGLVPESVSHEGYFAKPMHSYWDDFFALKGLKDAATICDILGHSDLAGIYRKEVEDYRSCLYDSMRLAMQIKNIDFIPGCAELGDFDATSTSIGIFPCEELGHIPQPALDRTFDRYEEELEKRLIPDYNWGAAYTPYEIRNARTFMIMGQKKRSMALFDFLFHDQRPENWNHWAEVVWRLRDDPKFIGDMPHTWIGSDYINSVRSMFVYEREEDQSLILAQGIPEDWLASGESVGIEKAPTYWGTLNYSMQKLDDGLRVKVWGNVKVPGKIIFKSPIDAPIQSVKINGSDWKDFSPSEVRLDDLAGGGELKIGY